MNESNNLYAKLIKIKRKRFWVVRWVEVLDGILIYKERQVDKQQRGVYRLADCSIQERIDSEGEMIILQQLTGDKEKVNLMADNHQEHLILLDILKHLSKPRQRIQNKSMILTKPQQDILSQSSYTFESQSDKNILPNHLTSQKIQQNEIFTYIQKFTPDENLLKNNLVNGQLMRLKSNYQLMIGLFNEDNTILIEASKDIDTYILKKREEKLINEKDKNYLTLAARIQQSLDKETQLLGLPLVIIIIILFSILVSLLMYLLLMVVDSSVYFYSCILTLNLILLPIISISLKSSKSNDKATKTQTKVMCHSKLNLDVNEFVYLIRNHELRKKWQPYLSTVSFKDNGSYKLAYYMDRNNILEESFSQNVYKDENQIIIVEHINFDILRIFQAIWQPSDDDEDKSMILKFYTKVYDDQVSQNAQACIKGLQNMIKKLKTNPKSLLFDYILNQKQNEKDQAKGEQISQNNLQTTQISSQIENQKSNVPMQILVDEEQKQASSLKQPETISQSNIIQEKQEEVEVDPEIRKFNKIAQDVKILLEQNSKLSVDNNWQQKDNSNGFQIHTKLDIQSGNMFSRGEGIIPYPIEVLYEVIVKVEKRGDYDELFDYGNLVRELGENFTIIYQKFKSMFIVSARDFVLLTKKFVNEDKSWTVIATSIEYSEISQKKGIVRGSIDIGGWILTPIENNTKTHAIFLVLVDPKASTAKIQGQCVEKIKKLLDKQHKKK